MPRGVASKVTNEMNNLVSPQDVAGNPAFLLVLSTTLMIPLNQEKEITDDDEKHFLLVSDEEYFGDAQTSNGKSSNTQSSEKKDKKKDKEENPNEN
ncbi:hypothetical protein POVCU2_0054360 [Plasmodium ovale curtisi]|nr:hypothetical protein POVCU2_0054360 [Plasmodium ovale curtisi]SBS99549.1 hypothetical protein POVCU1_053480 [Plasmodium ovale curtisi]